MNPYPAYCSSGIEWLGEIPEHWEVARLKWSVSRMVNGVWGDEPDGDNDIVCVRVADFDRRRFCVHFDDPTMRAVTPTQRSGRELQVGDLLLEKSGGGEKQMVGCVVLFDHQSPSVSSNFIARMSIVGNPRFWVYMHAALYSGNLNYPAIKQTTGIQNLDTNKYLNTLTVFPPLAEQEAIAAFLDRETERVEALIAKQRLLIERLEEYRIALITSTVTRGLPPEAAHTAGLDPSPRLKASGIAWLGDVPEHWEVKQLGAMGVFFKGSGGTKEDEVDDGVPCVRYGDIYTQYQYIIRETRANISAESAAKYTPISYGDILFAGSGETIEEIGKSAVNLMSGAVYCGGDVIVFRPSIEADATFMGYSADCFTSIYQKACMGRGVTVMHIYSQDIRHLLLSLPPLDEQRAIAAYLDQETERIDAVLVKQQQLIARLQEYRTALITAVVTGKIDVREQSLGLPQQGG